MPVNNNPLFKGNARIGSCLLTAPDASFQPTAPGTVFGSVPAEGSLVEGVEILALGPVSTATKVRLFVWNGTTHVLKKEIVVSATPYRADGEPYTLSVLNSNSTPDLFPLGLPQNHELRATITDLQVAQQSNREGIAASQSVAAGAYALLNGAVNGTAGSGSASSTNAISVLQTTGAAGFLTQTSYPFALPTPAQVAIVSGSASQAGVNFTVFGTDATGAEISETLAGAAANGTVYTAAVFATVKAIWASAAVLTTGVSVGYGSVATFPYGMSSKITIASSANLAAVNFTIVGTDEKGATITEVLAGPVAGAFATSANTYKTVTSVKASALANPTIIGSPIIKTPVRVTGLGGDFTA